MMMMSPVCATRIKSGMPTTAGMPKDRANNAAWLCTDPPVVMNAPIFFKFSKAVSATLKSLATTTAFSGRRSFFSFDKDCRLCRMRAPTLRMSSILAEM